MESSVFYRVRPRPRDNKTSKLNPAQPSPAQALDTVAHRTPAIFVRAEGARTLPSCQGSQPLKASSGWGPDMHWARVWPQFTKVTKEDPPWRRRPGRPPFLHTLQSRRPRRWRLNTKVFVGHRPQLCQGQQVTGGGWHWRLSCHTPWGHQAAPHRACLSVGVGAEGPSPSVGQVAPCCPQSCQPEPAWR